jgi:hypothetical protein
VTVSVADGWNDIEVTQFDNVVDVDWTFLLKDAVNYIELLAHNPVPSNHHPPSSSEHC